MSSAMAFSEAAIFGRILDVDNAELSPDLANEILARGFSAEDKARINVLAAQARSGELSADEREALNNYNRVGDLLALWHSKARLALQRQAAGSMANGS